MDRRRALLTSSHTIDPITGRGIVDGYEVVDLGLPSGLLWATHDIGAPKEDLHSGGFFRYGAGNKNYNSTQGLPIYTGTENPLAKSKDTATQVMGDAWRTPTRAQFLELGDNTTAEVYNSSTQSSLKIIKYTSKVNPNAYIIFAETGYAGESGSMAYNGTVYRWTSTPYDSDNAYRYGSAYGNVSIHSGGRGMHYTIRAVHAAI